MGNSLSLMSNSLISRYEKLTMACLHLTDNTDTIGQFLYTVSPCHVSFGLHQKISHYRVGLITTCQIAYNKEKCDVDKVNFPEGAWKYFKREKY